MRNTLVCECVRAHDSGHGASVRDSHSRCSTRLLCCLVHFQDSADSRRELDLLAIIGAGLRSDPGLCDVLKTACCCSSCDDQTRQADAQAWLLFTGRHVYACVLLIPLSRVLSLRGSGTSHTASSPGISPMSSLSKNRLRDSESCAIKWSYYYELLLWFQRWPSTFCRTLEFFI